MNTQIDLTAEIRASFFVECEELLEALHDGLQEIEDRANNSETINVVFRAVHSIKGGAGAFGLEGLVRFAHRFETVLEEVRSGRMQIGVDALNLFFQAADHLADLVRVSRDSGSLPERATAGLVAQLDRLLGVSATTKPEPEEEIDFQPMGLSVDFNLDEMTSDDIPSFDTLSAAKEAPSFTLHFKPFAELFETGNEPFLLLRNLAGLGKITVSADISKVPNLQDLAPESPLISWTVRLETDADTAEIASVFEFVEGLCSLLILPGCGMDSVPASGVTAIPNIDLPIECSLPEKAGPLVVQANSTPETPGSAPTTKDAAPAKSVVRVDLDRIERLVNLVGELVINQAMLSQSLKQSGLSRHCDAMNGLEEFQRLTRDIQDSVMMIRAQPVKSLFQRMSRIVRESSSAVEKEVRLFTQGEATEVDKTVIERLADPLTHMIRNAVDHGLETPQERVAAGKTPQGQIRLSAAHRSGRVIIEVADDGVGINRPKVLEIAIEKGLIPAESQLSDTEIDNLLFLPGFSTASAVSDLSGRGVGMDVVRTAIQALGGRITTSSIPGSGTTFSISLPLTLAVLDGMVIEVSDETLVLPLNLVIETLTLADGDVEMVRPGNFVVRVRGKFVPLFDLGVELGYRTPLSSFSGTVVLLIAHEDGNRAALVIDNILDQRQVVIKGLDESFYRAPGIAAATILGDGQIALIIDPSDMITNAMQHAEAHPSIQQAGASA